MATNGTHNHLLTYFLLSYIVTYSLGKDATHNVDNVGTNSAVLTTFIAIQQLKPDLIINAGTAGGFQRNKAAIGT